MSAAGVVGAAGPMRWHWGALQDATTPQAAVAAGEVSLALLDRLRRMPSARRERLALVAAPGWLVVLGPADDLPWADGVRYAAPSAIAPALWLPTDASPDLPQDLIAGALARRHGAGPWLLWPAPEVLLPLHAPQPAVDAVLAKAGSHLRLTRDCAA